MSSTATESLIQAAPLQDARVTFGAPLPPPRALREEIALSPEVAQTVREGRTAIENILAGRDNRFLAIVGPCSIHDPAAATDYARRLARLRHELRDSLEIVMRVYFEKPRTTVGWKGLVNDPYLDGSFNTEAGLRIARQILLDTAALGLPSATEFLDPIVPQYIADLVSWAAIGARTTESQTHREMASGLSMPVGFKNGTDGDLQTALDALQSANHTHAFLGIDAEGRSCAVQTAGNPYCHLVLRGGRKGTNFSRAHIEEAARKLEKGGMSRGLVVDCSHANSGKDATRQSIVWRDILETRAGGENAVIGAMLESNIHAGSQKEGPLNTLKYGVSITDGCIGWEETESLLREAARFF
ncbi:3-deoxy-7-phosphoheptulonate synthase [bacterium]|nr:MAG: 3-deoxy-7-phosphoheptulonate synthase [bacterium]